MAAVWHLLNFLCNIFAGWLTELFGNVTYNTCWLSVVIYSISVNSIPHVNNPVCSTVIPESESREVVWGTLLSAQDAVFMIMNQYKVCNNDCCKACACISQLIALPHVQEFMKKLQFNADMLEVIATLSNCSKGWTSFTLEEFGFNANMCINHRMPASIE